MKNFIYSKSQKAFTLIELILVIVILGILSTIGADIYTNIYRNYVMARIVDELESKTEIALEQISSRLSDRIPESAIGREIKAGNDTLYNIYNLPTAPNLTLEWLGSSVESRKLSGANQAATVGWSGFIDLGASTRGAPAIPATPETPAVPAVAGIITTPGSNLANAGAAITALTTNANPTTDLAMTFVGLMLPGEKSGFGYQDSDSAGDINSSKIMRVDINNNNSFTVRGDNQYNLGEITDIYHLSHSAYAIVPVASTVVNGIQTFDLTLFYDYKPWAGQSYSDARTRSAVLINGVTQFRFRGLDGAIEMKLCVIDTTGTYDFYVCKTKAVF